MLRGQTTKSDSSWIGYIANSLTVGLRAGRRTERHDHAALAKDIVVAAPLLAGADGGDADRVRQMIDAPGRLQSLSKTDGLDDPLARYDRAALLMHLAKSTARERSPRDWPVFAWFFAIVGLLVISWLMAIGPHDLTPIDDPSSGQNGVIVP